jgi:hypothetical protein
VRIEIENMPQGVPPGTYDVEATGVDYRKGNEPVLKLRFTFRTPPPEPVTTFLLVEVSKDKAIHMQTELLDTPGVLSVAAHNEQYPHGCCCQHCPHNGNCRD